ncbi:helix-turn-helix domain-containing protein [Sphingomonas aracearum]|uniref:Helix-turn-helix domain-containing protein n=1 Tax=Sphingomonas aracearum TaxID=2283317 RepID=A0A369VX37_9SPHN|nr:helix-turn-helix domain-containing protein [Sphingomonas aracearum]RDE05730.1 helix-turn-helix domain-containing protein [Sphingomonas aracearum]
MPGLRLDYAVPSPDLADYVALFYDFAVEDEVFADVERAGHAQFRFMLGGEGSVYTFADGVEQDAPLAHFRGATTGVTRIRILGPAQVLGFGLLPGGWAAMVGVDAAGLLNRRIDAGQLLDPSHLARTVTALREADDHPARIAVLESFVRETVRAEAGAAVAFMRSVDAWLSDDPSPDMASLIAGTGLSARQIERKCNALYGAPPKLLARKYRALRAAVALATAGEALPDLLARGFYDQSHLIRELKQFTGLTPRQILEQPTLLAQATMAQRSALAGQVHPITSAT